MQPDTPTPPDEPRPAAAVPRWLVPGLFLGLIAWGLYLAIGATFPKQGNVLDDPQSLVTEDQQPTDQSKPTADASVSYTPKPQRGLVVAVCFAIFLAWFWGLQKLYQKRRQREL